MGRILVVDDEPLICDLVHQWLVELECEMIGPASSVKGALSLIDTVPLDGAIVDVLLGGENSYLVVDALRNRRIPFAFATGYSDESVTVRFPNTPILAKPFTFEDLRAAVANFRKMPL